MYYGSYFSHVMRTLLKSTVLGMVLLALLAVVYQALGMSALYVFRPDGSLDLLSGIIGFPVNVILTFIDNFTNGVLWIVVQYGALTGLVVGLLVLLFGRFLKQRPTGVLCGVVAALAAIAFLALSGQLTGAVDRYVFAARWLPALLYAATAGWLGWTLRRGTTA